MATQCNNDEYDAGAYSSPLLTPYSPKSDNCDASETFPPMDVDAIESAPENVGNEKIQRGKVKKDKAIPLLHLLRRATQKVGDWGCYRLNDECIREALEMLTSRTQPNEDECGCMPENDSEANIKELLTADRANDNQKIAVVIMDSFSGNIWITNHMQFSGFLARYSKFYSSVIVELPDFRKKAIIQKSIRALDVLDYELFDWDGLQGALGSQSLAYVPNIIDQDAKNAAEVNHYASYVRETYKSLFSRETGDVSADGLMQRCALTIVRAIVNMCQADKIPRDVGKFLEKSFLAQLSYFAESYTESCLHLPSVETETIRAAVTMIRTRIIRPVREATERSRRKLEAALKKAQAEDAASNNTDDEENNAATPQKSVTSSSEHRKRSIKAANEEKRKSVEDNRKNEKPSKSSNSNRKLVDVTSNRNDDDDNDEHLRNRKIKESKISQNTKQNNASFDTEQKLYLSLSRQLSVLSKSIKALQQCQKFRAQQAGARESNRADEVNTISGSSQANYKKQGHQRKEIKHAASLENKRLKRKPTFNDFKEPNVTKNHSAANYSFSSGSEADDIIFVKRKQQKRRRQFDVSSESDTNSGDKRRKICKNQIRVPSIHDDNDDTDTYISDRSQTVSESSDGGRSGSMSDSRHFIE